MHTLDIDYEVFPRQWVQALEFLDDKYIKNGRHKQVDNDKDWEILRDIFKVWKTLDANGYEEFVALQKQTKATQLDEFGSSGMGKSERVRHLAEIPGMYALFVKKYYPNQNFSSEFTRKLIKHVPELRIPEKI